MHPVLRAAIDKPRFARPYGQPGEWGWPSGLMGVDAFMKLNIGFYDNDNFKATHSPSSTDFGENLIRANAKFARS